MDDVATVWLEFLIPFAVVAVAGVWLCRSADALARHWGVGGKWVGLILLATVTSVPELVTGIGAVVWVDAVDLAVGSALGSCVFNLAILVLLDLASRERSIYLRIREVHPVSARFGMLLLSLVGLALVMGNSGWSLTFGWIGVSTPLVFAIYLWAIRRIQLFETERGVRQIGEQVESGPPPELTARQAATRYGATAVAVIAAGLWLPFAGDRLAGAMEWHQTFVGALLIAFATSLPELVVALAALRIGAIDMAIGNLLGSNLFDIVILGIEDICFTRGSLLAHAAPTHLVPVAAALAMTALILSRPRQGGSAGLRSRALRSLGLVAIYLTCFAILYAWPA